MNIGFNKGDLVMKVLIINGSPHSHGTTARAIIELVSTFNSLDVETEVIHVGNKNIRGCIACGACYKEAKCVFDDEVNEVSLKLKDADGLILASPVYYASPNATLIALFYACTLLRSVLVLQEN